MKRIGEKPQWEGVVKVQWPLDTNDPSPQVFIRSEDMRINVFSPATEEVRKWMGGKPKVYANAQLNSRGNLNLFSVVADRDW